MTYMRRSGMMKEKTTNKDVRNRRLLLSSYWFYKVFSGANVLKTTLNVLLMEKRAAANDASASENGGTQKSRSKAARSAAAGKRASVPRKSSKTSAVSKDRRGAGLRKVVTKILKSARVF